MATSGERFSRNTFIDMGRDEAHTGGLAGALSRVTRSQGPDPRHTGSGFPGKSPVTQPGVTGHLLGEFAWTVVPSCICPSYIISRSGLTAPNIRDVQALFWVCLCFLKGTKAFVTY